MSVHPSDRLTYEWEPGEIPELNVPLLRKQLEWADSENAKAKRGEKSEWAQTTWCGTSCCIAGHTVLDLGWTHEGPAGARKEGAVQQSVRAVAAGALGLTSFEADLLFDGANDIKTLWTHAERITGGEITRL